MDREEQLFDALIALQEATTEELLDTIRWYGQIAALAKMALGAKTQFIHQCEELTSLCESLDTESARPPSEVTSYCVTTTTTTYSGGDYNSELVIAIHQEVPLPEKPKKPKQTNAKDLRVRIYDYLYNSGPRKPALIAADLDASLSLVNRAINHEWFKQTADGIGIAKVTI